MKVRVFSLLLVYTLLRKQLLISLHPNLHLNLQLKLQLVVHKHHCVTLNCFVVQLFLAIVFYYAVATFVKSREMS